MATDDTVSGSGEVAVVPANNQQLSVSSAIDKMGSTNLNPANKKDLAVMFRMATQECKMIWDERPKSINVVAVVLRDAEIVKKETGEVTQGTRTMFLDDKGIIWLTFGTVIEETARMLAILGHCKGQFKPPIVMDLEYKKLGPESTIIRPSIDQKVIDRLVEA